MRMYLPCYTGTILFALRLQKGTKKKKNKKKQKKKQKTESILGWHGNALCPFIYYDKLQST